MMILNRRPTLQVQLVGVQMMAGRLSSANHRELSLHHKHKTLPGPP